MLKNVLESKNAHYALLFVLPLLAYADVFSGVHEFLTYDDNWYIYENQNIVNFSWDSVISMFSEPQGGQYSPLAEFYHGILFSIFGKNAFVFKLIAIGNHILNGILLYFFLGRLFKKSGVALAVSLLFLLHPMQVEMIGWISAIYRIAVTWMLLAALCYLSFLDRKRSWDLVGSMFFVVLAFLTKEQSVLFPLLIVLIHLQREGTLLAKKSWTGIGIFAGMSVVYAGITFLITKTGGPSLIPTSFDNYKKLLLLSQGIRGYLYNFFWPFDLSFSYPYPLEHLFTGDIGDLVFLLLLIGGVGFVYVRFSFLRLGLLWYAGFMSLAYLFAFFHLRDSFMADRYAYFSNVGIGIVVVLGIEKVVSIFKTNQKIFFISGVFIAVFLCILTFFRYQEFRTNETIWKSAIEENPNNFLAYNSLGFFYRNNDNLEEAEGLYKKALDLNPKYYLAHSNLGKVYFERKNYEEALICINQSIALNPSYKTGQANKLAVLAKLKKEPNSLSILESIETQDVDILYARAEAQFKAQDYAATIQTADQTISLDPNFGKAYYIKGHSLGLINDRKGAIVQLSEAINRLKESEQSLKGGMYYIRGQQFLAIQDYTRCLADFEKAKSLGYAVKEELLNLISKRVNSTPS